MNPIAYFSKLWNSQVMQRIRGIQQQHGSDDKPFNQTTEVGTAGTASPRVPESARTWKQRYDRRSVISEVRQMLADNPLLAEAAQVFVNTAVSKSFTVKVESTAARGVTAGIQRQAQREIDRVIKVCKLRKRIPKWARRGLSEGDVFVQVVADTASDEVIDAFAMPTVSMERVSDLRDQFPDPTRAFRQVDITTNEEFAWFAEWQIIHARWNHEDGERYGNSQYLQVRKPSKIMLKMLDDLAVRRHTRAEQRYFFQVGTQEKPGTPQDVKDFMSLNKMDVNTEIGQNVFGNGMVTASVLKGDEHLDQIKDAEFALNFHFPRMGLAKGLVGFGEQVSRDILDDQRELFYTNQDLLIDWLEDEILRPLFDFALALKGINPEAISYTIQFEERMSEAAKLARIELYLELCEAEKMTDKQFITRVAPYLNIEDLDGYLEELREWKEELDEMRREWAALTKPDDDTATITRNNVRKTKLAGAANVGKGNVTRITRSMRA